MDVDRVVGHRQVADAHPNPVVVPHVERIDARKGAAVPGPQVEIEHRVGVGDRAAGLDVVGVHQDAEVAIDAADQGVAGTRMGHPEAHHPHRHLRHLVGMGVIHEGTGPARDELVDKGLARLDVGLGQAADPVHAVRQSLAVPVDRGVLGQAVGDEDAQSIAFDHFDRRSRRLAVVAPQAGDHPRRDLALDRFGDEMELLDAVLHPPRCGPAVQGHHRVVRAPGRRHQGWAGVGRILHHRLRQPGQGTAADY